MARRICPTGQPTRGKTTLNRLRQVDVYVSLVYAGTLTGGTPLILDVGFGAYPWTTLEMRSRWLRFNFQTILPRRLIHHMLDPKPAAFFAAWHDSFALARGAIGYNRGHARRREQWIVAVTLLKSRYSVDLRPSLIRRGYVMLRDTLSEDR